MSFSLAIANSIVAGTAAQFVSPVPGVDFGYIYDARSRLWQDSTHTTLATTVADPVGAIEDARRNNVYALQATSGKRGAVHAEGVVGNGTTSFMTLALSAATERTLAFVGRFLTVGGFARIIAFDSSTSIYTDTNWGYYAFNGGATQDLGVAAGTTARIILRFDSDGNTLRIRANGVDITPGTCLTAVFGTGLRLFGSADGFELGNGVLSKVLVVDQALTDGQCDTLDTYLAS